MIHYPNENDHSSIRDKLLRLNDEKLAALSKVDNYRASGPGGQHRNTTDSAVRITLKQDPTISVYSDTSRSQHTNKSEAIKKMRIAIALAMRNEFFVQWKESLKIGKNDKRYPFFLATVLDAFHYAEWKISVAAKLLNISTGKLNKIISANLILFKHINQEREKLGFKPLKKL